MALTKASELRQLSADELKERLIKLRRERYELIQKKETGQLDRPHRFGHIRRETAQIRTVLAEQTKGRTSRS